MNVTYRVLTGPIKQFLVERKMTQAQLADACEVERAHMTRVINGVAPLTWALGHRIAVELGVKHDAVMESMPVKDDEVVPL